MCTHTNQHYRSAAAAESSNKVTRPSAGDLSPAPKPPNNGFYTCKPQNRTNFVSDRTIHYTIILLLLLIYLTLAQHARFRSFSTRPMLYSNHNNDNIVIGSSVFSLRPFMYILFNSYIPVVALKRLFILYFV